MWSHKRGHVNFQNDADEGSEPFVSGIQQMLVTSLRQEGQLTLIEPAQIDALTPSGTTVGEQALDVGRWVGADVTISGAFADIVRVEADVVTAAGRHLGTYAAEAPRPDAGQLVQELVNQLAPSSASIGEICTPWLCFALRTTARSNTTVSLMAWRTC